MQSAGDVNNANISDMAALLGHADIDGLLRAFSENIRFPRPCTAMSLMYVLSRRVHTSSEEHEEMYRRSRCVHL